MANNPTDLSWLAGVTEKNASLTTQHINNSKQHKLRYNMKNNPRLIQEIHTLLDELEIEHRVYGNIVSIHRREHLKKLLSLLTPYLRGERRETALTLEY